MNSRDEQEVRVRRFLLGQLEKNERERVEQTLMVDMDYGEQVLLIEETLIEDYLDGALPAEERQAFETYFLASSQQRRKVKVATLLNTYGARELSVFDQPITPAPHHRRSINLLIGSHPVWFTSITALLLLILAIGVFEAIRSRRESIEADQRKLDIERELTQLSNSRAQDLTASMFALALAPVALRDGEDLPALSMPFAAEIIELRLLLGGDSYLRYTVELSSSGGAVTFTLAGLSPQSTSDGEAVVVRIPSRFLGRGDYKLSLIGISNHGRGSYTGEYLFSVRSL
jgi:hypothetical protein